MRKRILKLQLFSLILLLFVSVIFSLDQYSALSEKDKKLWDEHLKFGKPNAEDILIRNAYVLHYNAPYRIPNWVAYHIKPDYLKTPRRTSKFASFRKDPDVENPVVTSEYVGLLDSKGYARGHLTPYKALGGDRDNDGKYALYNDPNSDPDDEETIFQGNRMSNIAPQHHHAINGPGGLWYKLERWIQDDLVEANDKEIWTYAGNIIFDTENMEKVGTNDNIVVPNLFYKIVIMESGNNDKPRVLAFLFPHFKNKDDVKEKSIFKYLVTVDYLEAITGLDFFSKSNKASQKEFESKVERESWEQYINN